jgi:hypothetical protein
MPDDTFKEFESDPLSALQKLRAGEEALSMRP